MSTLLDRIARIEAARAAVRNRMKRFIDGTTRAARWVHLVNLADPSGPDTAANRRACRAAMLASIAQGRAAAAGAVISLTPGAGDEIAVYRNPDDATDMPVGLSAGLAAGAGARLPLDKAELVALMNERVRLLEQEQFKQLIEERNGRELD